MQITGALTALVTPFRNGEVDEESYRAFIEWQIEKGIDGLVPCGTTGESATLSHKEHENVIRICIDQAKKRVPVVAGAGSNNTKEAIELAKFAKSAGADAILMITPYYNKPSQEGLVAHYKAVAKEVSIPTIVYNVPGRTGVNLTAPTMARIYKEIPDVIGVKEATGNVVQVSDILELCDDKFILLSGDDFTLFPILALGGKGVISVVGNLFPDKYHAMCAFAAGGDMVKAAAIHYELMPLCRACFLDTNPVPVKTALAMMGKMDEELRLPLVALSDHNRKELKSVLQAAGAV